MRKIKLLLFGVVLAALLAIPSAAMAKSRDRDHDRMPDKWERHHGLSTHKKNAKADPDKDGLSNIGEFRAHTDPRDADSNDDGIEDGDADRDRDGVDNENEVEEHTNPADRDTDNDGVNDGAEDRDHDGLDNRGEDDTANDPTDPDTDDNGVEDGDEVAGTIASFDNGVLTITLRDGSSVSGAVNDSTRITCETEDEHEDGFDDRGGDDKRLAKDGGDDNSGPGSTSSGSGSGSDDSGSDDSGSDDSGSAGSGSDDGANHDAGDDRSGSGSGSGDDNGGDDNSGPGSREEHDGDEDNVCTTADLTPGTTVHEAELQGTGADAVFEKVELIK